jgi:hypothetical protein
MTQDNQETETTPTAKALPSSSGSTEYGQLLSKCEDVAFLRSQVEHLYQVLDDIDTASDMFKPRLDDPQTLDNYYRFTDKQQQRKSEKLVSDGYKLYLSNK